MTIGIYTIELYLPMARSLKDKRQVVKRLKDRLRARHNVAVAELPVHQELWQRAALAAVSLATSRDPLERLFEALFRDAEALVPGQVIETGRDFVEAVEAGSADGIEDWE